jgi:phasin
MRLGASQQQEATMAKEVTGNFEIPREMRALAEQSVEQARKAFDGFMTAAQKAASGMEGQASAAHAGAKDVRQKTMTFAEANVATSFEFAQKLVRAKDLEEVTRLQAEFVQRQMQALAEQSQELSQTATRAAMDATRPKL